MNSSSISNFPMSLCYNDLMIMRVKVVTMTEIKANVTDIDEIRLSSSSFLGRLMILIIQ